jgi:predicted RNA-binding protein associated with RNAse of E/G family
MERKKYIGRPAKYIKSSDLKIMRIDEGNIIGFVAYLFMKEVHQPRIVGEAGKEICIADNGYSELCYLPDNENWMLWAIYDNNGKIIEWYFDITKKNTVDDEGNPYCDDLYLDIALMPDGQIIILDEDELNNAYKKNLINKNEYDMAHRTKNRLINEKIVDVKYMENLCKKIFEFMKI